MTWKRCRAFSIAFIFSAASLCLLSFAISLEGVHRSVGDCGRCHLKQPKAGEKLLFARDIDSLCKECHYQAGAAMSHPSNIKPTFPLPPEFPLDWSGKMTCATCHQFHGTRRLLLVSDTRGKSLCMRCHRASLPSKGTHGHGVLSTTIHRSNYVTTDVGSSLDAESRECLSCHDGASAGLRSVTIGAGSWSHGYGGVSHPIGVDYRQAQRKGGYRNMAGVNKQIRFFDGKLGCGSCHSIYSALPAKLIMRNSGSALCLECHQK